MVPLKILALRGQNLVGATIFSLFFYTYSCTKKVMLLLFYNLVVGLG